MEPAMVHPPRAMADRYELSEVVGSGGVALVWRAHDRLLDRQVAIKVLAGPGAEDRSTRLRFQREARHIASLSHRNIVTVYDVGFAADQAYIVMEYVDGPSLRQLLQATPLLNPSQVAELASGVLAGLSQAHRRGVVHRDIKPGNILLSAVEGTELVRVADFGVARTVGDTTELTAHGTFVGTATYASPEQFISEPVGAASDLYSLGCVLYRCLAGRPPFEADDVERLMLQHRFAEPAPIASLFPGLPEPMAAAITRSLEKNPERRFGTAEAMAEPFARWASGGLRSIVVPLRRPVSTDGEVAAAASGGPDPPTPVDTTTEGTEAALLRPVSLPRNSDRRRRTWARNLVIGMVALAVALGAVWALMVSRGGGSRRPTARSVLASGGTLQPGQSITSPNGTFDLNMQFDGNLVEYRSHGSAPLWATGTSGNFGAYAVMQVDGDFVVYPHGESAPATGRPTPALWSTGTYGLRGSALELLDDGVIVVRGPNQGAVRWTSGG